MTPADRRTHLCCFKTDIKIAADEGKDRKIPVFFFVTLQGNAGHIQWMHPALPDSVSFSAGWTD